MTLIFPSISIRPHLVYRLKSLKPPFVLWSCNINMFTWTFLSSKNPPIFDKPIYASYMHNVSVRYAGEDKRGHQ